MVDFIVSFISLTSILALPPIIKYPGLLILLFLMVRGVRSILSLRPFRLITSVILFVVVAFILSRFGGAIAMFVETTPQQP